MLSDFALIFAAAYAINLALYFGGGLAIRRLNTRCPERRIQKGRDGMRRAAVEIRESVISIAVTAACLSAALTLQRHGLTLWTPPAPTILWVLGMLAVTTFLFDGWFYWMHRLLHTKPFWRFHRDHHKAIAPTVWSSDSQSVVETFLTQLFLIVAAILLPVPAVTLVLHRVVDHINSQFGHAGFEYFAGPGARAPSPMLCAMFHDRHHERFTVNFANFFSLWDRWMGTLDAEYDRDVDALAGGGSARERA